MRSTIAPEFGCSRGSDGSAPLKGESGANGRQQAPGQLPDRNAPNADEQPPGPGLGDGGSGGDGSEGVGSEGVGSEGVGSDGVGSEGIGSDGVGSEGAGSEGAG